jgi:tetratricopeptide (TPR) repeat protein
VPCSSFCSGEASKGSRTIKRATVKGFLISSSFAGHGEIEQSVSLTGRYQKFCKFLERQVATLDGLRLAASELERIASYSYSSRRVEELEYASRLMLGIPVPGQQIVSAHYQSLCCRLRGEYEKSLEMSWRVAESPLAAYRTRAFLNIGNTHYDSGRIEQSLPFYAAVSQMAADDDPLRLAQALWMIANVRVRQGDCKNALKVFEKIEPIVRFLSRNHPTLQCDFLNDIAFALGEAGRIEEGLRLVQVALSSPYAPRFPYWTDTRNELEAKREATPVLVHIDLPQENSSSPAQTGQRVDYNDYLNRSRLAAPAAGARGRPAPLKSKRVDKTSVIPRGPPR